MSFRKGLGPPCIICPKTQSTPKTEAEKTILRTGPLAKLKILSECKAWEDKKCSKTKSDIHNTRHLPYSKAQTALGVVFYGHKEGGPGGFKPEPHKRRRRALESHSKEVFKSSAKYYTNFNTFNQFFFACLKDFCKTLYSSPIFALRLN